MPSVRIAVVLVAATAVLLASAVGLVLFAGYQVARLNTAELVRGRSEFLIGSIVERTRGHLDPVQAQLEFLADLITREHLGIDQPQKLGDLLLASLAAVPQETVVAFATPDLKVLRAFRNRPSTPLSMTDWSDDPGFEKAMAKAASATKAYWDELYVAQGREMPFINLFVPVHLDGAFAGALIAGVAIKELSEFLDTLGGDQLAHAFILYGPDAVLAHAALRDGFPELTDQHPLPSLEQLGDPVLARIWTPDTKWEADFGKQLTNARVIDVGGSDFVFLLQELTGYGEQTWIVGTYAPLEQAVPQLDRLTYLLWVGSVVLVVGLGLAFLVGRSLSHPIQQLAEVANRLRELNFEAPPPRLRGPFRELNEAASAFDAMIGGLRLFATYVPRSLVRRLMRPGSPRAINSEEREVSVMFTDIAGFTTLSEHLPAFEVAAFLNRHFMLVDGCVEASEGTVDKYIGDAVMAFWGAPGEQPDHAERACRTALSVAQALRTDNEARAQKGLPPVRVRIGIHSGRAVVGNIGAPSRVNYTVVGDVVNVAERLEELARTAAQQDEAVSVLVGSATAAQLGEDFELQSLGSYMLRGRREPLEVFQLRVRGRVAAETEAAQLTL